MDTTTQTPPITASGDSNLPSPDERQETDVVVYDGHCGMCSTQIAKLPWWDCQNRLSYLSLHDPRVAERYPELPPERLANEMAIVDRSGAVHWGPEAIRYLTRRLRRLWWAAPLFHFPGSMLVWRPLYRWTAANRYWLSGSTCEDGTCPVHREK